MCLRASNHDCTDSNPVIIHAGTAHAVWCAGGASSDDLRSMVDILHSGAVTLKGVARPVTVMFLLPMMLSGRAFPSGLPGKAKPSKAKLVAPSRGLQCSVRLPPDT